MNPDLFDHIRKDIRKRLEILQQEVSAFGEMLPPWLEDPEEDEILLDIRSTVDVMLMEIDEMMEIVDFFPLV